MSFDRAEPTSRNDYQVSHAALLAETHRRLTGRDLLPAHANPAAFARALYEAPFVLLAHDTAPDPVFFYANLTAQRLFEMSWAEMTALPSRHSAEPDAQSLRQDLLNRVARDGYIDDYAGVRVSKSGRRFQISGATVWTLSDDHGRAIGQAATFATSARL
jgi:hypothetical protein